MALTNEQHNKIGLISDTVLYSEAVGFVRRFVQQREHDPLPTSLSNGLMDIARDSTYSRLISFVEHQKDRDWPPGKLDIKEFYTTLEKDLKRLKQRMKEEFHLTSSGLSKRAAEEEENELMSLLVREFITHLAAENDLLKLTHLSRQEEP
jgi:hypothetical protein